MLPGLALHFVSDLGPAAAGSAPQDTLPVVYEPRGGIIRHDREADTIVGSVRGVQMRSDLRAGVTQLAGGNWKGEQRYIAVHTLTTLILMEALKRRGRFPLHAACLSRGGRGVLIAGSSGAGKSTLAIALARAGLEYLSDDLVFLQRDRGGRIRAGGFADAVGVTRATVAMFPELSGACQSDPAEGSPKHLVRIEDALTVNVVSATEPAALVFPEIVDHDRSRIEPLDPAAAWLRLVPDVMLTDPAASQAHLEAIAELTRQVSCHRLQSSRDLQGSAMLVAALL